MSYIAPEDKQIIKYFIEFNNEADGVFEIDMPIGFDKMKMKMKTNTDGYGRYLEFSDELDVIFVREFNHQFDLLRKYVKKYAWHTDINFFMQIDGINFVDGKIDFESSFKTDYSNEIKCKLVFQNLRKKIESKKSTPIELNSNKAIDNITEITPIELEDLLTKYKAILSESLIKSTDSDDGYPIFYRLGDFFNIYLDTFYINPFAYIVYQKDVNIVTNNLGVNTNSSLFFAYNNYTYLEFSNKIAEITVNVKDLIVSPNMRPNFFTRLTISRIIQINDLNNNFISRQETILQSQLNYNDLIVNNLTDDIFIDSTNIILRVYYAVYMYSASGSQIESDDGLTLKSNGKIEIFVKNILANSITKSVKLINVGEQIIKSVTNGNEISNFDAPRFKTYYNENKINFKDLYATSGLFLRGFNNEKFTTKWNDWVNFIRKSLNCDYQIYNNKIFLGHYKDFRNDIEIARFDFEVDTENFDVTFNSRLIKSNFKIGYKKYEDDEQNTKNSIHQEAEFLVVDSNLTDETLDYSIDYICDAYKIEYTRRESFTKDATKTTPNDKDIYVIDTFDNNGILENRTNQGLQYAYNIFSPETYYNLRLSIKRLLYDYFSNFLAEISQYNYEKTPIINVDYKPNKDAIIKYNSNFEFAKEKETIESGNFISTDLENPLVTGQVYEFTLLKRFEFVEFLELVKEIMETGGYLTFFSETKEINIFPTELYFEWELNKLKIKGEEKWTLIS